MGKTYFTILYAMLVVYWFKETSCASSVNPVWVTNTFFETKPAYVKTDETTTFNFTNPINITFTFTKTYTQIPQLAFGIKNYRGNDQLGTQNYAITRDALSLTGFRIYTMIDGNTNIRILTIMYLAVDRSFLYHLNVFSDIPANYSNGNLVNITGDQIGVREYRNVINYTILANSISSPHTLFGLNMAKNKVALFLNAIYNKGNRVPNLQVKYSVTTQVLSADQFEIVVICQPHYKVDLIRFSLVAMDIEDIQKSGKFTVVSYYVDLPATSDQYIPIPRQFATNTLIGLVDFTAPNANYGLEFNWEFDLNNDRIIFNHSVPYSASSAFGGLTAFKADIFYLKTWNCPATHIYFNLITNMCDDYCAKYLYQNSTAQECQVCNFGCYECTSGPSAGCTLCNAADNREFVNGTCPCKSGFYPDPLGTTVCVTCNSQMTGCATCQKSLAGLFTCLTCASGYVWTGTICLACSITDCMTFAYISSSCQCTQCATGYIPNGSGGCALCSFYMPNCLQCTSQAVCTVCNNAAQYYLNTSSNQCQTCNILGCTTCNNLTTCLTCNNAIDYFLTLAESCQQCNLNQCTDCLSLTECVTCNTVADYFLNTTTKLCQLCSLTGCTDCASLTTCVTCDNSQDYFLDGSLQCPKCSLSGCLDCASLTTCVTCDSSQDYFLNASNLQCPKCSLTGCLDCASSTTCVTCDEANDYFLDASNQCIKCPVTGCLDCASISTCSVCNEVADYFLNGSLVCQSCTITGCTDCSSLTQCSVCDTVGDYFFNNLNQCVSCSLTQCLDCNSLSECLTCNISNDFFLNTSNVCEQCSLTQCLDCDSLSQCLTCNNANNYFINSTSQLCQPCIQTGCLTCTSLTTCSLCDQTTLYFLNTTINQCYYCNASLSMFVNATTQACQQCSLNQCTLCQSLTQCNTCNQAVAFFINNTDKLCYPCSLTGCLTCQTLTTCKVCDSVNNYGLTSDGTCKQCPFTCACDGYVLPKYLNSTDGQQYCSTLCGDGMKRNFEECDDGNTVDGDGCSSTCTIEKAWSCDSNPTYTCCTLESNQLTLSINKILKVSKKNAMTLVLEIKPKLSILTPQNMKTYVKLIVTGVPLYNESRVALPGQILQVTYFYNQSINGKKGQIAFEISFSQVGAPSCVISASKNITIMAQASNNLPFMFYTEEDLARQDEVADSANALEIITYVIFFLSMIPCKIIGLELIGVIQLAYFSLAQQENINILLEPFMKMNEINGFNADWLKEEDTLPDQVSALGIKALFLNNCNVMLLVIVVEVLTAGVLYGVSHVMQSVSQKLASVSKYLIKEGLLTLMMFNAFNIAFGVGVHFQYADKSDQSYVASSAAAILASGLLFAVCALLMFTEAKQFGEFKDKLKPQLMCQLYFVFSLGYRFALGYYIAVKNEYILSSLVIVGFCMVFIGYNLINLPFTDAYHNYRANICHCAQLVILFVTNYYDSLTENKPLEQKAYQFSAAEFQIAAIYVAVAFSAGCLVVDAYKFIKAKFSSSEASSPLNSIKERLPEGQINQTLEDFEVNNSFHMKDNEMEILSAKKK